MDFFDILQAIGVLAWSVSVFWLICYALERITGTSKDERITNVGEDE